MGVRFPGSLTAAALAFACSSSDHPALIEQGPHVPTLPSDRIPQRGAAFQSRPCWATLDEYAVECGTVSVPARGDDPGSGTVELAVAVVYSNGTHVAREPVVFLDGGPGAASIEVLLTDMIPFDSILEANDLVLFDQRGTGYSTPRPDCTLSGLDVIDTPGGPDAGAPGLPRVVAECRVRAEAAGVDLSIFRSAENAADATRVREALGYVEWNLYGISYGTRYALTVLRDHPAGVRTTIIDSVVPLQADLLADQAPSVYQAIHAVATACLSQPKCHDTYGDIEAKAIAALERIAANPPELLLDDGTKTRLDAEIVAGALTTLMYSSEAIRVLPELIQEITDEDYTVFEKVLSSDAMKSTSAVDRGTFLSVTCADEAPFSSQAALDAGLSQIPEGFRRWLGPTGIFEACAVWNVPPSPPIENQPVTSSLPTLVMSGGFDPVTPPSYGALAAKTLSHSQVVVLSDEAHGSSTSACGKAIVRRYLDAPASPAGDRCAQGPPLSFLSLDETRSAGGPSFDTSRRPVDPGVIQRARRRFPFPMFGK